MKKWIGLVLFGLMGCSPPPPPSPEPLVTDVNGYVYRLVEQEKKRPDGTVQIELWERITPPETNHWYTPTLSSKVHGGTPMFNSIQR